MNRHEPSEIDREQARELLGVWAMDALDPAERELVEHAIREDPELRAEAESFRSVTSALGEDAAVAPPASLRESVFAQINEPSTENHAESAVTEISSKRRGLGRGFWLGSVAASIALVLGIVWGVSTLGDTGISQRDQFVAIEEVLERPGAEHYTAELSGGGEIEAATGPEGTAVLTAADLPEVESDRTYQLWAIAGDEQPESLGLLEVEDGRALTRVEDLPQEAVLALTVEPEGGSEQPTTEPIGAIETT